MRLEGTPIDTARGGDPVREQNVFKIQAKPAIVSMIVFMNLLDHLAAKKQLKGVLERNSKQIELAATTYARLANNLRARWERRNVVVLFDSPPGFC